MGGEKKREGGKKKERRKKKMKEGRKGLGKLLVAYKSPRRFENI